MSSLEHRLTANDLIVAYLIEKTKQGYIPEITKEEFIDFLKYFTLKKEVSNVTFDYDLLINQFLSKKTNPHKYHIELTKEGTLKPTYMFGDYDNSIITPYFMTSNEQREINDLITEYLKKLPRRTLDNNSIEKTETLEICKLSSAIITEFIWKYYIEQQIKSHKWPKQCNDIIKYLLEEDLATKIELESVKEKYIEFYNNFAKISSFLLNQDSKLEISSYKNCFLPYSHYELMTMQEDNLLRQFCKNYGNGIRIDYSKGKISVSVMSNNKIHYKEDDYDFYQIKFSKNKHAKKLVKAIEKL